MKTWFSIKAKGDSVSLSIFDEIGGFGISAQAFIDQLNQLGNVKYITLLINSPGGSVSDGVAIYNALKRHPAHVTVEIIGWCLSIASHIAMAGNHIRMTGNGLMMIHNAWSNASGDADALRERASILEKASESLISAYMRSGKSREQIAAWMDAETWFTAEEALAAGLIDEIAEDIPMAASFDPAKYYKIPPNLGVRNMPTKNQADDNVQAALRAEQTRRNSILALNVGSLSTYPGITDLINACANEMDCTVEMANTRILNKMAEGTEPMGHIHIVDDGPRMRDFRAAAVDALLIRNGIRVAEPSPLAHDLQRYDITAMAERILSMQGKTTVGMDRGSIIKAAHSTSDFPLLLANTAGKALRIGYDNEPSTFTGWTGEKEVADFKTQSLVALSEAPDLKEVPEGAEYTHGTFGEAAETFNIKTYGRLFSITRQALINDDLGAMTGMPNAFGAAARRLEADLVYEKLTGSGLMSDSKALFHIDHGNLAGTPAALSVVALGAARAAMRSQKGINSLQFIDPQPRFLIVPVALETLAEQIVASLVDPSKSNDTTNPAWVRGLTVVADPRLDADSETAWYLAASPVQMDTIIRAYLAGQSRPYFETEEEFSRDVTAVKSRHDVAAAVIDFRGLYKNAGAA